MQIKPSATNGQAKRAALIRGQLLRKDQVDAYQRLGLLPSLFPTYMLTRN